jgi:hypothetical protein
MVGTLEWHIASKHLKQYVSCSPNIDWMALVFIVDDFRRLIIHCTDESTSSGEFLVACILLFYLVVLIHVFGISEVDDF